jgi:hypothetical protein
VGGYVSLGALSQQEREEYAATVSTAAWSSAPSASYRLFFDLYNLSDFFDTEPGKDTRFPNETVLSDTVRPVATLLWDERFRFQAGVIAQRTYGDTVGFGSVDPWVQALWQPTHTLTTVLGNLSIPHDYLPAIFYSENYFLVSNNEKGMQLLHRRPGWNDDLFFNYQQTETATRNEKFNFGYVHHNEWRWLFFTYQAHWIHYGGTEFPHPDNTINDSAQTAGLGLKFHPHPCVMFGADYYYLHSHYRVDSDNPALLERINGNGHWLEAFIRWSRLRVSFGDWHGSDYSHEGGDPYFTVPNMQNLVAHWDILVGQEFNLFGETTAYFIGNNELNISHYVKPTFWVEAAWHFAWPRLGWSAGGQAAAPSIPPERWDEGY